MLECEPVLQFANTTLIADAVRHSLKTRTLPIGYSVIMYAMMETTGSVNKFGNLVKRLSFEKKLT
jgi:hypothetical protein